MVHLDSLPSSDPTNGLQVWLQMQDHKSPVKLKSALLFIHLNITFKFLKPFSVHRPAKRVRNTAQNATRERRKETRVGNSRWLKENCSGNRNSQRKMSTLLTLRKKLQRKLKEAEAQEGPSSHRENPGQLWPSNWGKSGKHFLLITARQEKRSERWKWKRRKTRQRQFRLQHCQTKKDFEFQLQRGPRVRGADRKGWWSEGRLLVSLKNATAEHADVPRPHNEPT